MFIPTTPIGYNCSHLQGQGCDWRIITLDPFNPSLFSLTALISPTQCHYGHPLLFSCVYWDTIFFHFCWNTMDEDACRRSTIIYQASFSQAELLSDRHSIAGCITATQHMQFNLMKCKWSSFSCEGSVEMVEVVVVKGGGKSFCPDQPPSACYHRFINESEWFVVFNNFTLNYKNNSWG